jgi:flagellar biosynthesis protein FlhB
MSEDSTQPASKRRRQLARQQGQVAHSPELTASVGWLVAVATLGAVSKELMVGMTSLIDRGVARPAVISVDQSAALSQIRAQFAGILWPVAIVLVSFATGAFVAHQLQVRGLWATRLLVPDPARLWAPARGANLGVSAERMLWSVMKAILMVIALFWSFGAAWGASLRFSELAGLDLARAVGQVLRSWSWTLGGVLFFFGLFEMALTTTPEQQREDRRVMEGDPAARAQRFRVARSWRRDSADVLAGASLVLTGPAGLTLVLAGGPPPRVVSVQAATKGAVGLRVRRLAEASNVSVLEAPDLARRLVRRPVTGSAVAARLITELAVIWPVAR